MRGEVGCVGMYVFVSERVSELVGGWECVEVGGRGLCARGARERACAHLCGCAHLIKVV